jgi:hypothetical protein
VCVCVCVDVCVCMLNNSLQAQRQAEFALASGKSVNVRLNQANVKQVNINRVVHGNKVHSAQQVANECKSILFVCNLHVNFSYFS